MNKELEITHRSYGEWDGNVDICLSPYKRRPPTFFLLSIPSLFSLNHALLSRVDKKCLYIRRISMSNEGRDMVHGMRATLGVVSVEKSEDDGFVGDRMKRRAT